MNFLNRKNWVTILFIGFVIILAIVGSTISVIAQDLNKITYPVADLGNCANQQECKAYCSVSDNYSKCAAFAKKIGLDIEIPLEQRAILEAMQKGEGPGKCKTKESCMQYCDNSANAVVCMEFALKAGFIPKEDAEAVSKILPYLKSGGKLPGGCTTKESCDAYCGSGDHASECADFAVRAGFMTPGEAEIMKKTGGKSPGNCKSKEVCD